MTELLTLSAAVKPCALYRDHGRAVPVVTQGHHTRPVFLQNRKYGRIKSNELMYVCGTCHDNIHAWLYYLLGERKMPEVRVPDRAKRAAQNSYNWFMDPAA